MVDAGGTTAVAGMVDAHRHRTLPGGAHWIDRPADPTPRLLDVAEDTHGCWARPACAGPGTWARRSGTADGCWASPAPASSPRVAPADFLLVHGDPLTDPGSLWRVWRTSWQPSPTAP